MRLYDGFTPEERIAIQQTNDAVLPPDSPTRYLLEGRGRPGIAESTSFSEYRHGVCLAHTAIDRQRRMLAQENHQPVTIYPFNPDAEMPRLGGYQTLYGGIVGKFVERHRSRTAGVQETYGRITRLVEGNEWIDVRSFLLGKTVLARMPFITEEQIGTDLTTFLLGLGDGLELYHHLYGGEVPARGKCNITLSAAFGPTVYRSKVADVFPEGGLVVRQNWDAPPYSKTQYQNPFEQPARIYPRYKAVMQTPYGEQTKSIWWNNHVPTGARLRAVGSFVSHHILRNVADGHGVADESAFYKGDVSACYVLEKEDVLVFRGHEGAHYTLSSPFVIPKEMTHEQTNTAELIALARNGELVELTDTYVPSNTINYFEISSDAVCQSREFSATMSRPRKLVKGAQDELRSLRIVTAEGINLSVGAILPQAIGTSALWHIATLAGCYGAVKTAESLEARLRRKAK